MRHDPDSIPAWAKVGSSLLMVGTLGYGLALWPEERRLAVFLLGLPVLWAHAFLARRLASIGWAAAFDLVCYAALAAMIWTLQDLLDPAVMSPPFPWLLWLVLVLVFPGTLLGRFKRRVNAIGDRFEKIVQPAASEPQPLWKWFLSAVARSAGLTLAIGLGLAIPSWLHLPNPLFPALTLLPAAALAYRVFDGPRPAWPYALPFALAYGLVAAFGAGSVFGIMALYCFLPMDFLNRLLFLWTGIPKERLSTNSWRDKYLMELPTPPDGGPWKYRA